MSMSKKSGIMMIALAALALLTVSVFAQKAKRGGCCARKAEKGACVMKAAEAREGCAMRAAGCCAEKKGCAMRAADGSCKSEVACPKRGEDGKCTCPEACKKGTEACAAAKECPVKAAAKKKNCCKAEAAAE